MTAERITDFSLWDIHEEFDDYQVAYLWLGLEPSYGNDHPSNVISFRHALSEAKSRGEVDCRDNSGRHSYRDKFGRERGMFAQDIPRYQRQSLRNWAERIGQRPLFLFPEYRSPINPADNAAISTSTTLKSIDDKVDNLSPRAKSTLLKMLDAALSQQYGNDWLDGDIDTRVIEWIKDLETLGIELPAERRSMTRWITKLAEKRRNYS